MSWKCRCELCRDAFTGKIESHHWLDFLRHREAAVLELVPDTEPRTYLAEVDRDVLVTARRQTATRRSEGRGAKMPSQPIHRWLSLLDS